MTRLAILALLLLTMLPAAAEDFDTRFGSLGAWEGQPYSSVTLIAEGDFTTPVVADYTFRFHRGDPSVGTVTLTPASRYQSMTINAPNDNHWEGHRFAELTVTYTHPITGALVTKEAPVQIYDDDFPTVTIERTVVFESAEPQIVTVRIEPSALIPLDFSVINRSGSAKRDEDYSVSTGRATFDAGQTTFDLAINAYPDGVNEITESFSLEVYDAEATITIVDPDLPTLISPAKQTLMSGDAARFDVTLPWPTPWPVTASIDTSNPEVALSNGFLPFRFESTDAFFTLITGRGGDSSVTVSFDTGDPFNAASAELHVWGDTVQFGDEARLSAGTGETVTVPIHITPPPPGPVVLTSDTNNVKVATSDLRVTIDAGGDGLLNVTGLTNGSTTINLYSPNDNIVATLAVDVLHNLAVTAIAPQIGRVAGGTEVTITGSGFLAPCTVTFNDKPATNVTVVNATTLRATTPANAAGPATVNVTCSGVTKSIPFAYGSASRGRAVRH